MNLKDQLNTLKNESPHELESFLKNNLKAIFNTHHLNDYYQIIKEIKTEDASVSLIIAWLAMLCGDNANAYLKYTHIDEQALDDDMLLFYKSLESLASFILTEDERLKLSNKTIASIKDEHSFFAANAYLTHGQILAGYKKLNDAADMFYRSYTIFLKEEMIFPAVISMTNALLNWFRLGDFKKVISHAKKTMLILSSTVDQSNLYANIIALPLGMTYLEENKVDLSIDYLLKAYDAIVKLELIHMHGYVEMYLMRAYHLISQKALLEDMVKKAEATFYHMHYPMMEIIVLFGKMLLNQLDAKDIEKIEAYDEDQKMSHPIYYEMLAYLYNIGKSKKLDLETFEKAIDELRYEGDVVHLQKYLVLLSERYYVDNQPKYSIKILEEVVKLYKTHHLISAVYLFKLKCFIQITKIDPSIKRIQNDQDLLTQREIEILELIGQGKTNEDISNILFITIGTVKWHMNHILSKLDVKNRRQAYEKAKQLSIIKS